MSVTEIDRTGRDIVVAALDRVVSSLGLDEHRGPGGDAALPLLAVGGPLDGQRIGEFRVFTREDGTRVVYSALSIAEFGMDTHQVYAFSPTKSAVPHLFLDTAIAPNTEGTFHFGLDLVPRVDLGACLDYSEAVYAPLTEARAAALAQPGVMPVPSLGPVQWSVRSPWMAAAIVAPEDLGSLSGIVTLYLDQWLALMTEGLPSAVFADVAWQDVVERDRRNRAAMFSPRTNPVWALLDRLVGEEAAAAMKSLLTAQV